MLCCGQDMLLGAAGFRRLSTRDDGGIEDESVFWENKSGKANKPVKEEKNLAIVGGGKQPGD